MTASYSEAEMPGGGPCALCGANPAIGYASINERWYCHPDSEALPDCYGVATSSAQLATTERYATFVTRKDDNTSSAATYEVPEDWTPPVTWRHVVTTFIPDTTAADDAADVLTISALL